MLIFIRDIARLHIMTTKGYTDSPKYDYPQLKACIFIVKQEQAFEVVLKWRLNVNEAKPNSMWLG